MKKRRPLPLLLLLLLLTLAPCQPSWAQIPFVRGKAVDQRLTQLDILGDSVGLNFADRQPLVAARADVQVAFGSVRLLEWGGWLESAFATFLPYPGATRYHAYVRGGQYAEFTPLDRQLIRLYPLQSEQGRNLHEQYLFFHSFSGSCEPSPGLRI